jgi:hypothetical protein
MSLLLEHRWEHALVAAVIDAAKKSGSGSYLGRTAIQKLVYFLHVLDVPMKFKFRIHHYGPFCDELAGTLDWLQADDIVVDDSTQPRYSDFTPGKNWSEVKTRFGAELDQFQGTIDSVANALGSMDAATLELIATIDFSYRWVHARGGCGPWKDRAEAKFKEIKGTKFTDSDIDKWYDKLVAARLIEA